MPKVLIDVILISAYVPPRMPDAEANTVHRTLHGRLFMSQLRQALQAVVEQHPTLRRLRLTLTR